MNKRVVGMGHRRRVSVICLFWKKKTEIAQLWLVGGYCWFIVQYDVTFTFLSFRSAFFVVAEVGCHVDEELERWI